MRTVYLGTSDFAVAVLARLARSDHRPALVVTRPDRPKGRGRKVLAPPVATAAKALGIELAQPEDLHARESLDAIAAAEPDALIVCAFGALVKEPLLADYEILNVHPSLLPRWRGAAPIERALMAGDEETGVAIMRLTAGLDSGPVALQVTEPIRPDDDYGTLAHRLEELGARLLIEALDTQPVFAEQTEGGLTYAEKITAADRTLDPDAPAGDRERVVRALRPHIGARMELADGSFVGVWDARVSDDEGPLVWRGLELVDVQPAGGRRMAAADWLRGRDQSAR
ncbi:MAG: methionyl-tRNA formyltransferase [Solirubrobacteraceae bacterium]